MDNKQTEPKKKYRTYKDLSSRYAITIPALKEHLRQSGWLVMDEPTTTGLENAELRLGEHLGKPMRQWKWEESSITALMEVRGVPVPDQFQKAAHVCNTSQAGHRLGDIAFNLCKLIEPFTSKPDRRKLDEAHMFVREEIFPHVIWPASSNPPAAIQMVKDAFKPFTKAVGKYLPPKHPKRLEADRWLDATNIIALWLAKQKPQHAN